MSDPGVSRDEFNARFDGLRNEVSAAVTAAGVQIGAVEKTLTQKVESVEKTLVEKLGGIKLWGVLALVGGQTFAALVVKFTGGSVSAPASAAAHVVVRIFTV